MLIAHHIKPCITKSRLNMLLARPLHYGNCAPLCKAVQHLTGMRHDYDRHPCLSVGISESESQLVTTQNAHLQYN